MGAGGRPQPCPGPRPAAWTLAGAPAADLPAGPHGPPGPAIEPAPLPHPGLVPGEPPWHPALRARLSPGHRGHGAPLPAPGWPRGARGPQRGLRLLTHPPGVAGSPASEPDAAAWRGGPAPAAAGPHAPDSAGLFRRLELSERRLQTLQKARMCRALEGSCLLCFIPAPGSPLELPIVRAEAGPRHSDPGALGNLMPGLWASSPAPALLAPGLGPFPFEASVFEGVPPAETLLWSHGDSVDDNLLQAAIRASLQDEPAPGAPEELRLPKSSVSSLRLQQLERMGFSTEQAVVALAATGRVEGAVSLLVEGQVGDAAQVTSAGREEPAVQ
ncbi:rhomboid domain-containing protein 3 isoform X4 [Monodelphis domestica]|uniref:rhomboid domain-containing protein 3 isoform X4 n=1 Tax=Monodelphis domestica TaxID=13616 RepID=UPI0024E1B55F|nr:rhomboid domain-containing protein 3 isoform X4 [Monodelphis domestica]